MKEIQLTKGYIAFVDDCDYERVSQFEWHATMLAPQIVEAAAVGASWERRRDESPRAYTAFQLYLHADNRRLADVGAKLMPACSAANVARWSTRHNWQTRAWSWDKEQDRIQQEQEARDRTAARKRHLAISQEMQSLALRGLLELKAKAASGGALNMSFGEVENMLTEVEKDRGRFSVKLERLVIAGNTSSGTNLTSLSDTVPGRISVTLM